MERAVLLASMTNDEVLDAGREACGELRAVFERHGVVSAEGLRAAMADVGDGDVSGLMLAVGGVVYLREVDGVTVRSVQQVCRERFLPAARLVRR